MFSLDDIIDNLWDYFRNLDILALLNILFLPVLVVMNAFFTSGYLLSQMNMVTGDALEGYGILFYGISILGLGYYLSEHLSIKRLLEFLASYAIYLGGSYILLLSTLINNPNFKAEKTFSNDFWEIRYLPTIAMIIVVAGLVKVFKSFVYHELFDEFQVSSKLILSGLMVNVVLCDSRLVDEMVKQLNDLLTTNTTNQMSSLIFSVLIGMLVYIWPLTYFVVNGVSDLSRNRASFSVAVTFSFIFALLFNYTLQLGVQGDEQLLGKYIFPGAMLYQALFLGVFFILIYSLINRFVSSTLIILCIGTMASIANGLKVQMRSEPLLLTDLVWLKQLGLLLGFVDSAFVSNLILALVVTVVIYIVLRRRFVRGKILKSLLERVVVVAMLSSLIYSVYAIFRDEDYNQIKPNVPVISKLNNWQDINWLGFETNARYKSLAFVWTKQLAKRLMDKPEHYSKASLEALVQKYSSLAKVINSERTESIADHTVIYLLSESLANPNRLDGIQLSDNPLPFLTSLSTETTSGLMKSDFYGGGTANMEFQALTGLPFYNFSPSIAIAYTEVVPKLSYMPSISQFFTSENRIAIHPANARNYDRYNVYQKLDFNRFLANDGSPDKLLHNEKVGVSTSDAAVYQTILDLLETSESQFYSVITMQNHAPWSAGEPADLTAVGEGFDEGQSANLSSYVKLLWHTDTATADFLEALKAVDKKITVVFYGDHLPGFYPVSIFKTNPERQYQTDYFIWSNYQENKLSYPLVNSSDFTAELFEHTNAKVSPYYALLTEVLHKTSVDKSTEEYTEEQKTLANDLKLVQYDLVSGNGYLLKHPEFFAIQP